MPILTGSEAKIPSLEGPGPSGLFRPALRWRHSQADRPRPSWHGNMG